MNMDKIPSKLAETPDRSRVIEEIFNRYHKDLVARCEFKLMKKGIPKKHAEDIVMQLHKRLFTRKGDVDLTRNELEIRSFLDKALDSQIKEFIEKSTAKKRAPAGGFESLDEIREKTEDEENLDKSLKEYFVQHESENDEKEEMYEKIERAISALGENEKDIITKIYKEGKTPKEIAKVYGFGKAGISKIKVNALKKIRRFIKNIRD